MAKIEPNGLSQRELVALLTEIVAHQDGIVTPTVMSLGSTHTNVATTAFTYNQDGVLYSVAAVAAGTALTGTQAITQNYWQVYRLIATRGVNDVSTLSFLRGATAAGYTTEAGALAALPAVTAGTMDVGYMTLVDTAGAFTEGTTHLDVAGVTVTYYPKQPNLSLTQ